MVFKPRFGVGGKPMFGADGKPLTCEADESCCALSCEDFTSYFDDELTSEFDLDLSFTGGGDACCEDVGTTISGGIAQYDGTPQAFANLGPYVICPEGEPPYDDLEKYVSVSAQCTTLLPDHLGEEWVVLFIFTEIRFPGFGVLICSWINALEIPVEDFHFGATYTLPVTSDDCENEFWVCFGGTMGDAELVFYTPV